MAPHSSSSLSPTLIKPPTPPPPPMFFHFNLTSNRPPPTFSSLRVSNCIKQELRTSPPSPISTSGLVSLRLHRLVSEFRSLPEPIDRVKRLLDYASVLTQLTDSTRSPDYRIAGCAAQVWLEVQIDDLGRMRFGADSDSEITKGFCSCLIYLLDSASPHEVLMVKGEDLTDMNVGLPVRSRVNSWHNVLVSMQDRTRSLILNNTDKFPSSEPLSSLVISPEDVISKEKVLFS